MKGLAIGDLLLPTPLMTEVFKVEGLKHVVTECVTTEFKRNRDEIRTAWRNVEEYGPEGETPPDDMEVLIQDVDILAVHICPVSAKMLEAAPQLKVIGSARGGLENIDVKAATQKGIAVINTPHHNAQAVAEYTIGLILAETRNIARSHLALKTKGEWREYYPNTEGIPELNGSTIGLIGFGQNGRLVAKKLQSFDVNIVVYDPFVPETTITDAGCTPVDFTTLLQESDVVSIHVRLSPKTQKMIGEKEFRLMKPTAYFINTARAGLVDLDMLKKALEERWIMGAAIDVYAIEPVPRDYPLFALDNITVTNHRAGDTRNAYWKAPLLMGEQIAKLLKGETPDFLVNPSVLDAWTK